MEVDKSEGNPGPVRPTLAADLFAKLPGEVKGGIRAALDRVGGTVRPRIALYWVLLIGTLTLLGAGIWASYFGSDVDQLVTPFRQASTVLTFLIPISFLDGIIESLARLASARPVLSTGIFGALVVTAVALFVWRQSLKAKGIRRSLDGWQALRDELHSAPAVTGRQRS